MKKYFYHLLTLSVLFTYFNFSVAQTFDLSKKIPVDTSVLIGEFENGFRYYIKQNSKPENKVIFRLAIKAGSILEDEDQQGLAHFVEHMGFNGTKNFEKNQLVSYLQSIGVKFGSDLNAYTSFDETVYMLPVPTTREGLIDTALLILEDWAFNVTFDPNEIDKERGVILEEKRGRKGAGERLSKKYYPYLFKDSKYAERLPIGKEEILTTFKPETIKRFYKDWYRPNLMAIIAVGDLEPKEMKAKIEKHFASYRNPENNRERKIFEVPDQEETYVVIMTDEELTSNFISIYNKDEYKETTTWEDYRRNFLYSFFTNMLNNRYYELTKKPNPPFLSGSTHYSALTKSKNSYMTSADFSNKGEEKALKTLLSEIEKVKRYGFTDTELERTKLNYLKGYETRLSEKDKRYSSNYVSQYAGHFLNNNPIPNIETEFEYVKHIFGSIKIEEVNQLADNWFQEKNLLVLVGGPENEETILPTKDDILNWISESKDIEIKPYEDELKDTKLMAELPENSGNVKSEEIKELGVTILTLSNGIKVYLKPTDFQNNQIILSAFSPGGTSVHSYEEFRSANYASSIINVSGINGFSKIELSKLLAGKMAYVSPYIGTLTEGISGGCIPNDLETCLQLTYLYFTKPNFDEEQFSLMINENKINVKNQFDDPNTFYSDQLSRLLRQNHPRGNFRLTEKEIDEVDHNIAYKVYKNRFADANDFTFFFVGNFDVEKIKPLLNKYLGSLPTLSSKENWVDHNIRPPKGKIERVIKRGKEAKSKIQLIFTGETEYNTKNVFTMHYLDNVLKIKLIENLREKMSGVYSTGAWGGISKTPYENYSFYITIPCGPENVDKLVDAALAEVKKLKENGPTLEDK